MDNQFSLGVIGCGNMGSALVRGVVKSGLIPVSRVYIHDINTQSASELAKDTGVQVKDSAELLLQTVDIVILAIKPQVFDDLSDDLRADAPSILISIMAGISSEFLKQSLPERTKVVRVMPNFPLSVGEGASAIETGDHSEETLSLVQEIFSSCGKCFRVEARQMDAVTGLSGGGPMYCAEFFDGLVTGGVKAGLSRKIASELALQTLRGTLDLLAKGMAPSEVSSRICSPGGTTIYGLHTLEKEAFKATIISAIESAVNRSKELGE